MKTKIPSLSYDAMFKAVFRDNSYILSKLTQAILDYYGIDINVTGKELIVKKNELSTDNINDRRLICDYIIKIDDNHEINLEINRSIYNGHNERNLTYSFKIYYEHFKTGDDYSEFNKYILLQVNFNNYKNPNNKCINRFYLIDAEDNNNILSNNYSIMNIDIAKCHDIVYNESNLEEISDLITFGAITYSEYLEDIASILERGKISMSEKEKEKFLSDVKNAAKSKDVLEAVKLETSIEDRYRMIAVAAKADAREEARIEARIEARKELTKEITEQVTKEITEQVTKEITEQVTKDVTEQVTDDMINSMLNNNLDYNLISKITGKTLDEIKEIENNN